MPVFEYTLPAVRGIQAGHEFFVTMCPFSMLSSLFRDDVGALRPDIEAQRFVNEDRIPEIIRYVLAHRDTYVFSALTAAVDSPVRFDLHGGAKSPATIGNLYIPISARLILLDGQHRCAAMKDLVIREPKLAGESMPVVILVDVGFKQSSKLFTDLKCHERKASRSLRVLHDDHDLIATLTRELITLIPVFNGMIELSRSTISNRSRKLFTLSALYQANRILLADRKEANYEDNLELAASFWKEVAAQFPEWSQVKAGELSPAELRKSFIHVHGLALSAIARAGRTLVERFPKTWPKKLRVLKTIDWSRSNASLWEGRAMIGGRLSKANSCVMLAGNSVKKHLGLALSDDEAELEKQFRSGR